jgi:hypothetical protein
MAHFSSGDSNVPCTAVTPQNEERLNQLIHTNWRIMTRELCMELNVGFNVLEMMVETLEYCKVCTRWVPRILIQDIKKTVCKFVRIY